MTDEEIKKMEQWSMVMALLGFNQEQQDPDYEEYDNEDQCNLFETINNVTRLQRRMKDPDPWMSAALRTIEMGVTDVDIYNYRDHLDRIEELDRQAEQLAAEAANPEVRRIMDDFRYKTITHKRYTRHTCWEFTMPSGTVVQGRLFRVKHGIHRVWLAWTDSKGVKHRHKWDAKYNSAFAIPTSFPQNWREWYGYTSDPIRQSKLVTWMMATKRHKLTGFPIIK